MFRFEKFGVWQKSIEFADHVYDTPAPFPQEERFGLARQLRRAAVSISSNLAEGSGRASDKDNAHYVEMAYGSLMEVVSQLEVSVSQQVLPREKRDELYAAAEEIARMLSGLRAFLLKRNNTA